MIIKELNYRMNSHNLPPLPPIHGNAPDLTIAVYTRQLNSPTHPTTYDSERLAELGTQVLDLATTKYLYNCEQPALDAQSIRDQRTDILQDDRIIQWLEDYNLKAHLQTSDPSIFDNQQEMKKFFLTYVAAVFLSSGLPTVENWISQLIDPNATVQNTFSTPTSNPPQFSLMPPQYSAPPPPPPPHNPPPLPTSSYTPSSSITPGLTWLSLATVNQTAAQKRVNISYQVEPAIGPPHAPTWTVHCYMDGEEKGIGKGKSTKAAKEEAARNAYLNMGWM
ncbi:hypothetical protein F5878DRAFT_3803 [Lentinula raphanica]|uniref:Uncharacterized protein n=1 Tax=Lentinula raphanica TaxID=153919 RepID=A0AA38PLI2_9AGAR|nr:hypothetical protein F5878DRAFT_3803 [Lentinula raphanica]